jgi:hypothetical protein
MRMRRMLVAVSASAALAAPLALTGASPAAAATPYARLSITPSAEYPGYYNVVVSGHFHTTAFTSTVGMRLKGDDPVFNDDLSVSGTGQAINGDFAIYRLVWHSYLNEDWEGRDEIFAVVDSSTGWRKDTPNVNGYF